MAKSAIETLPALLATPTAAAAVAGTAVVIVGIAGTVYYLDQENKRQHVQKLLRDMVARWQLPDF